MNLHLASVILHILAAIVWLGGMWFLPLVVTPAIRGTPQQERAALVKQLGLRFRTIGWGCIVVLVVTGVVNLGTMGFGWSDVTSGRLFAGAFGQRLALKLVFVVAMVLLSAVHDFIVGPRATAMMMTEPGPRAERVRRRVTWLARVNAVLGAVVVVLAASLTRA